MVLAYGHPQVRFLFVALFTLFLDTCSSLSPADHRWKVGMATWYGERWGAGSNGGACGYKNDVYTHPFSSMISAASGNVFKGGLGCGSCYEVKCTAQRNTLCSGKPVRVVITDSGPGMQSGTFAHFDLSGTAFQNLATRGNGYQLLDAGILSIQYRKVGCNFRQTALTFEADAGANNYAFALVIKYQKGDAELSQVQIKDSSSPVWNAMVRSWGAVWRFDTKSGTPLNPPFSFRITQLSTRKTIQVDNIIPANWYPGGIYKSTINFPVSQYHHRRRYRRRPQQGK